MPDPKDLSPSPPPAPPIPLTPGPRAIKFSTLLTNALNKTLSTVSLSKFSACFPTPAAHSPHILASVHAQITAGVEERARREFEEILRERDVVAGLNELERLVGEARVRRETGGRAGETPPHLLPPSQLYLAHLAPYLATTERELNAELQRIQTENADLAQSIQAQRNQADTLLQGLERAVNDLEAANEVLDDAVGTIGRGGLEDDGNGRDAKL